MNMVPRQPDDWRFYRPSDRPPPPPVRKGTNWYRVGAIICWVLSAYFAIEAIQILSIITGVWGAFVGTKGTVALFVTGILAVGTGWAGWLLWRHDPTKPINRSPGWKRDPWNSGGGVRYWDGHTWTPYYHSKEKPERNL